MVKDPVRDLLFRSRLVMTLAAAFGVLLLLGGGALLTWAEGKAINTARSLEQGSALAATVSADRVDPANDGKVVHLTGPVTAAAPPRDPLLGVSAPGVRLVREVEIYAWKEKKNELKRDARTTVTYAYTPAWTRDRPLGNFAEPEGHRNPEDKPFPDARFAAADARVGAFTLTAAQLDKLPAEDPLPVTRDMAGGVPEEYRARAGVDSEGRLYLAARPGGGPDDPQVGDVRVRYKVARPEKVTVVAAQKGSTFEPYTPEAGEAIDLIEPGEKDAGALFASAHGSNQFRAWLLRVVAFLLFVPGLFLVVRRLLFDPADAHPDGVLYNAGLVALALGLALAAAALVIGVRWLWRDSATGGAVTGAGLTTLFVVLGVARLARPSLFGRSQRVMATESSARSRRDDYDD